MIDFILLAIYVTSGAGCAGLVAYGVDGMKGCGNNHYDTGLIPGVAGFAVFPVINTMICIILGLYCYEKHSRAKRNGGRK